MILEDDTIFGNDDSSLSSVISNRRQSSGGRRNAKTKDPNRFNRYNLSVRTYDDALKNKENWLHSSNGSAYYIDDHTIVQNFNYAGAGETLKSVRMIGILPRNKHGTAIFLEDNEKKVELFHISSGSILTVEEVVLVDRTSFKRSTAAFVFKNLQSNGLTTDISYYMKWVAPVSINDGRSSRLLGGGTG